MGRLESGELNNKDPNEKISIAKVHITDCGDDEKVADAEEIKEEKVGAEESEEERKLEETKLLIGQINVS